MQLNLVAFFALWIAGTVIAFVVLVSDISSLRQGCEDLIPCRGMLLDCFKLRHCEQRGLPQDRLRDYAHADVEHNGSNSEVTKLLFV